MQKRLSPQAAAVVAAVVLFASLVLAGSTTGSTQPSSDAAVRAEPQLGAADFDTASSALDVDRYLGPRSGHRQVSPDDAYGARFFRVECSFSHFGYDDPVTAPGARGKAPLRMFFGNTDTSAATTYDSLIDRGASTCSGGPLDRSAYVLPAVLTPSGDAVVPSYFIAHYNTVQWRGGAVPPVTPFPPGLQLSAGDRYATQPQDASSNLRSIEFGCDIGERGDDQLSVSRSSVIPRCDSTSDASSSLKMTVRLPFCWDGTNLAGSDGVEHVVYPPDTFHATDCPASHPVLLPSIEMIAFLDVGAGADTSSWFLSTDVAPDGGRLAGGTSMHGDWWGGWHRGVLDRWVGGCSNVADAHCAQGLLGASDDAPALRRLEPAFGPYHPFGAVVGDRLLELCPGKRIDPDHPELIAWCGLDGKPAQRANARGSAPPALPDAAPAPEVPAAPAPDAPAPPVAPGSSGIEAYDTAWEMAYKASPDEVVAYLDHLASVGFDGTWFSLLPFGAAYDTVAPGLNEPLAYRPSPATDGRVDLSASYTERVAWILDQAAQRELRVGVVVAWARANTCNNAMVTEANGSAFGSATARAFADSPAVRYWVLGGDIAEADCGPRLERTSAALADGLRSGGADQPIAFHTGAGQNNYLAFHDAPWLDAQAVQTGHCQDAATMGAKIARTVGQATKPVILAESRYYQLAPPWRGCLHNPSNPVDHTAISDDVSVAGAAGVAAILYGDALRYQWCEDKTKIVSRNYKCDRGIAATFNTPGEQAFLRSIDARRN